MFRVIVKLRWVDKIIRVVWFSEIHPWSINFQQEFLWKWQYSALHAWLTLYDWSVPVKFAGLFQCTWMASSLNGSGIDSCRSRGTPGTVREMRLSALTTSVYRKHNVNVNKQKVHIWRSALWYTASFPFISKNFLLQSYVKSCDKTINYKRNTNSNWMHLEINIP